MPRSVTRVLGCLVLVSLALAGVSTCTNPFSPPDLGPTGVAPIRERSSPDNVLENFRYSYLERDIDVYENQLDFDFVFVYFDPERIEGIEEVLVPRDGPSGDLERTRRLFAVFDEIALPVFNVTESDVDSSTTPPLEVRRVAFRLLIADVDGDFDFASFEASGDALFTFRRSATDGLWRIVRWEDLSRR